MKTDSHGSAADDLAELAHTSSARPASGIRDLVVQPPERTQEACIRTGRERWQALHGPHLYQNPG
jgi:hypothetical protein